MFIIILDYIRLCVWTEVVAVVVVGRAGAGDRSEELRYHALAKSQTERYC